MSWRKNKRREWKSKKSRQGEETKREMVLKEGGQRRGKRGKEAERGDKERREGGEMRKLVQTN